MFPQQREPGNASRTKALSKQFLRALLTIPTTALPTNFPTPVFARTLIASAESPIVRDGGARLKL